jgi:hypothetical protein
MASPAVEARNRKAREAGFRNYYEQRLAKAQQKHGQNISRSQARGHPATGEIRLTTLADVKSVLDENGRAAAFRFAQDNDIDITHDQWSLIFGSPKLRSHRRST